jgi:hypothetical protein
MTTLKALFADYFIAGSDTADGAATHSERAGAIGRLGLVMGMALMVGSGGGPRVVSDFQSAHGLAIALTLASLPLLYALPTPSASVKSDTAEKVGGIRLYLRRLATLDVLKKPGAWVIVGLRICMTLAFWVFYAVWTPSLKARFDFGPKEQGQWMAFIGLSYAIGQGVVAKPLIGMFAKKNPSGDPHYSPSNTTLPLRQHSTRH